MWALLCTVLRLCYAAALGGIRSYILRVGDLAEEGQTVTEREEMKHVDLTFFFCPVNGYKFLILVTVPCDKGSIPSKCPTEHFSQLF